MEPQPLSDFFRARQGPFVELLQKLAAIPSHSGERLEINRFLDAVQEIFAHFDPKSERRRGEGGDLLRLSFGPADAEAIVFLAHVDTVRASPQFPAPKLLENRLYGRGTLDMKCGIAMAHFVLLAFQERDAFPGSRLELIFTPDEELGSPWSKPHLLELCRGARAVLVCEPPGPGNAAKTRRKAVASIHASLTGKAAHSGLAPEEGRDANRALAKLTLQLDALAGEYADLSFNPGIVQGGTAVNAVSPASFLQGEVRTFSNGDLERFLGRAASITEIDGVVIAWRNELCHPALERTRANAALYGRAAAIMAELSYDLPECASGGASDGSSLSAAGIPVLDGIGMRGRGAHTPDEYVDVDDFPPRAYLLARLIEELS